MLNFIVISKNCAKTVLSTAQELTGIICFRLMSFGQCSLYCIGYWVLGMRAVGSEMTHTP